MQIDINSNTDIQQLIAEAHTIGVIPSKIAGFDAFAAGVSLTQMLKEADKNVHLIYLGELPQGSDDLQIPQELVNTLNYRDLVVSVDYNDTNVDSFKYNNEENILTFRLGPVPKDFDIISRVKSKIATFDFDLCFVLGAQNLHDLGSVYDNLSNELHHSKIINLDNTKNNNRFGVVNIIEPEADGLSYLVLKHAPVWNLQLPKSAAISLLKGMTFNNTI